MSRQAEIRERLEKMDDREWKKRGLAVVCQMGTVAECPTPQKGGMFDCQGNATFIAAAPGDIRYLLDRLERAEQLARDAAPYIINLPVDEPTQNWTRRYDELFKESA